MCFSARVSAATGLVCYSIALFVYKTRPDRRDDAIYLLIYSSMQFADLLLHMYPRPCTVNWVTTSILVPSILSCHLLYNSHLSHKSGDLNLYVFTLPSVPYLFHKFRGYSTPSCNRWKSPVWAGKEIRTYEFLLYSTLILYPSWNGILGTWCYMYFVTRYIEGGYGSMWCTLSCAHSLALLRKSLVVG